jgi:hypothetical protein
VLPVVLLVLSAALAALFYGRLPAEVAYHFSGGTADRWAGRGALTFWLMAPQVVLTIVGVVISGGAAFLSSRLWPEGTPSRVLLLVMGNMVALPQVVLAFAMLDIFLYNVYQIHLIPLWAFVLLVMVVGGVVLGVFFVRALRQAHGLSAKNTERK